MTVEYRAAADVEIRTDGDAIGRVTITPVVYKVRDSYRTFWEPGVFDAFLDAGHGPAFCWNHNAGDPIGQMVDFDKRSDRLRMNMQLDDFEAVPRARQAYAQMKPHPATGKATVRSVSVGFEREDEGWFEDERGETHFTNCRLPEVSAVIDGAVPGAVVDSVRGVPHQDVLDLARQMRDGDMTLDEALATVRGIAYRATGMHAHAKQDGSGTVRHSHADAGASHAHSGLMPMMIGGVMGTDPETREQWTTAYINALPDSAFAYIEEGGQTDSEGKTTPRSLRHFPYKDADGTVDLAHLRNALARVPQSDLSDEDKATAQRVLSAAAKAAGRSTVDDEIATALAQARSALRR